MERDEIRRRAESTARSLFVLASAMVASVLVYVVVGWVLTEGGGRAVLPDGTPPVFVRAALIVIAVVALLAGEALYRVMMRDRGVGGGDPGARLGVYRNAVTVSFAVREAAAIVGLVLTLLTGRLLWVVGFGAVVVLVMLMAWPRRDRVERIAAGYEA